MERDAGEAELESMFSGGVSNAAGSRRHHARRRALPVFVAACVVVVLSSGLASADWQPGPSGEGAPHPIHLVATPGRGDLYPGFGGGDLSFVVADQLTLPLIIDTMTASSIVSSDPVNCPAGYVRLRSTPRLNVVIPLDPHHRIVIEDVVIMRPDAPIGCQGVAFTIAMTVTFRGRGAVADGPLRTGGQ